MASGIHWGSWDTSPMDKGDYCIFNYLEVGYYARKKVFKYLVKINCFQGRLLTREGRGKFPDCMLSGQKSKGIRK